MNVELADVKPAWTVKCQSCGAIANPDTRKIRHRVVGDPPDMNTLEDWMFEDGGCEATDGCWVETDGICEHGHKSWMLTMGLI